MCFVFRPQDLLRIMLIQILPGASSSNRRLPSHMPNLHWELHQSAGLNLTRGVGVSLSKVTRLTRTQPLTNQTLNSYLTHTHEAKPRIRLSARFITYAAL
jgi:hypothetical protein